MSYRLILSVLLSTLLILSGCTTTNTWHPVWNPTWHTPWHKKPHHPKPPYYPVPAPNQNVYGNPIQTPYVYSNHMPNYTRVGTPYTVTNQVIYPNVPRNNLQTPYVYSYNMPHYTRVGTPYTAPPTLNPYEVVTQNLVPSYFDSIEIDGTLHVVIKGNQPTPCIKITGPRYALKYMNLTVVNNVLTIRATRNTFGVPQVLPISIEIDTNDIQNLTVNGNGTTIVSNIGAQGLNLSVSGNGSFNMTGNVVLYQLNVGTNSNVGIYWVNTNNLIIHAGGYSKVSLAGVATNLEETLTGSAVVDAKYLRSQVAYVKTKDSSCAWVYVSQSLSAYANNYSDIYYYPDPIINGPFYVHDHGSIMRMAGLPY